MAAPRFSFALDLVVCGYLIWLTSSNSSFSCFSKIAAAIYIYMIYLLWSLVSLASLFCRHNVFAASRHVNSRRRQRARCQHRLASQVTAQTCTVVQCDYSHQIRQPLLFPKLPQQSRCRQNRSRYRRLCIVPVCLHFGAPSHVNAVQPVTSQNIGLFLVRFFDARSLALFSDVYLSNVIDIEPHLAMGDYYLAYSWLYKN